MSIATPRRRRAPASATPVSPPREAANASLKNSCITETRGAGNAQQTRHFTFESGDGGDDDRLVHTASPVPTAGASLASFFLPEGYPHSVTPDYLPFQAWDTVQAVCSYLRGILCVQAIMAGWYKFFSRLQVVASHLWCD